LSVRRAARRLVTFWWSSLAGLRAAGVPGIETALATGAGLLAGVGLLFAWRAPETYDRTHAAS